MNYLLMLESLNKGKDFADAVYFKNKTKFKIVKWLLIVCLVVGFIFLLKSCLSASALSQTSFIAYADVTGTDSNVTRLLTMIPERENYLVSRVGEFDYFIFYGDSLEYKNNKYVSDSEINYIRYYRLGSGMSYQYYYDAGSISSLSLNPNNFLVSSNIDDYKFNSRSWSYDDRSDTVTIKLLCMVFLPIILFANLWGCIKHEYI